MAAPFGTSVALHPSAGFASTHWDRFELMEQIIRIRTGECAYDAI
jgi:hypothetical protein